MRTYKSRNKEVLFLGGWLFTDLLLLLTILFFIGNADIKPSPPTPTPTQALPRLELNYRRITLSIDPDGLLNNAASANGAVKQQVRSWENGFLSRRSVGLAIVYAGAPDTSFIEQAFQVDQKIYGVLDELGKQGFAFSRASHYDPLYLLGADRTVAKIDIYLFVK
jgi:hypothetical protein